MNNYIGFIYEWTNKINNKKYIGAHTGFVNDGYTGGGSAFKKDLKKYGLDNFERKIIEYVTDERKIKDRENYHLELVDAANSTDYYNKTNKSSGLKKRKIVTQSERKLCSCNQRYCAVNYTDFYGITHYRGRCEACIKRGKRIKPPVARWQAAGYKKKPTCDRCGFRAKYAAQLIVCHVDGNLHNTDTRNLKTVCLNCQVDVVKADLPWRPGDLEPDV